MLAEGKLKQLTLLIDEFSKEELIWMNGYLAGIVANSAKQDSGAMDGHDQTISRVKKINILYGTETGNSKRVAMSLATEGKKHGVQVKVNSLDQYRPEDLVKEEYLFLIVSTHGDGEPPASAKSFYTYIHQSETLLPNLKFSVLALGDSSYPQFCQTGIDIDTRLQTLGAIPIIELQKCDVDFDDDVQHWIHQVVSLKQTSLNSPEENKSSPINGTPKSKKIYQGTIKTNINLNDRGSNKQTYHLEITSPEPITYEPGDAMGIIPANRKVMVDLILSLTGIDKQLIVDTPKCTGTVEELLRNHLNICHLNIPTIRKYASITNHTIPDIRMDLVDLLLEFPLADKSLFGEVVNLLAPIAPRLYSISSSPAAHGNAEIHLTVSRHSFHVNEDQRFGLCSDFLGELPLGTPLSFYIHKNRTFRLPATEKDIIMIGPGTGIAPFRSFLSERDAIGASGKNWLFFGDQHFTTDFLYQSELQNFSHTGVLSKLSLAFSRDQPEKKYVQHRILEQGNDLFEWITRGASIYVCGTKDPNSIDIENALLKVFEDHGDLTTEESKKLLIQLENENRYVIDVY
ncbi:MAG: flavodoxin domain-containing protein [Bacteroidota bacterium]|nr:flavodoxin domain-containing protein [Bacteroidota bacterium]